nr:T9SS type A sorting domain-containing protein [uncultured Fluviicola sp.]
MIRLTFFTLLFLLANMHVFSQTSIYAITNDGSIIRIDPGNCSYETLLSAYQIGEGFNDIAFANNELYVSNANFIRRIDFLSGTAVSTNLEGLSDGNITGLTGDENGNLYASGDYLTKAIPSTGSVSNLGSLGGYYTVGDLEIYNNVFYISVLDTGTNKLIKVQTNPFLISEIGGLPPNPYGITKHQSLNPDEAYISTSADLRILNLNTGATSMVCPQLWPGTAIYGLTTGPDYLSTEEYENPYGIDVTQQEKNATIRIENPQLEQSSYCIQNALGQVLFSADITSENTSIDLNHYPIGVLFLTITKSNQSVFQKKLITY